MVSTVALSLDGLLTACGEESPEPTSAATAPAGHVHGLGVNPTDSSLFIATHGGLFRVSDRSEEASRVGSSQQDTMGFTVVGPDRFLGSGHPGPTEGGPPNLGLIESSDAGAEWNEVSLAGEADLHVLRSAHDRVYAVDALTGKLMLSDDGGESWDERSPPPGVIDLAVDPEDPERILISTERGLALSEDDGETWKPVGSEIGLLSWPEPGALYLVDAGGQVQTSQGAGAEWSGLGAIGGQPAAFAAESKDELYAALADGSVQESRDGGASWSLRAAL